MIDKLNLTTFIVPDINYLNENGKIIEDLGRGNIYKFLCRLDRATVLYHPHKFGDMTNANIPFTKIDVNPKYFACYSEMLSYILDMFINPDLNEDAFNVSRLDIAADIAEFPIDCLLSTLRIARIRSDSLSFFKGTIYAGSNPKIRIYDKISEIKARLKKGIPITSYEQNLVATGKSFTRFEIQIRTSNSNLKDIVSDPVRFASHFERLEIFDFKSDGIGVLQTLYKFINRKFRKELENYRDFELIRTVKENYIIGVSDWLGHKDPF